MRTVLILLALLAVAFAVRQHESPEKFRKLEPLVGRWSVVVHVSEPKELEMDLVGTMTGAWALNQQYVKLEAAFPSKTHPKEPPLTATGYVTYDEAAVYEKRKYRAMWLWSNDGRTLPMEGSFTGNTLTMKGTPISADNAAPNGFVTTAKLIDRNHIEVSVDCPGEKGNVHLGDIRLTRL